MCVFRCCFRPLTRSELNTAVAAHARDLRTRTRELDEKTAECNSIRDALTQQQRETATLRRYVTECEVSVDASLHLL